MLRKADQQLAKSIGARVREHRLRLRATQEEMAETVGLSTQVYSRLERGGVLPSVPSLMRLCDALRATPNDILTDAGHGLHSKPSKAVPAAAVLERSRVDAPPELFRLVRLLSTADRRALRAMLQLVRGLKGAGSSKRR